MNDLFFIAMKYLGLDFAKEDIRELFQKYTEMLEVRSLPGEFNHLGGSKGAAIHNVRIFLSQFATREVRQQWVEAIPELA